MWNDITAKSKVRLVWQETVARTEEHGPKFGAELTVVKLDCAKSGHAGSVRQHRHLGGGRRDEVEAVGTALGNAARVSFVAEPGFRDFSRRTP